MSKIKKQYYDDETDTFWIVLKSGSEASYEETWVPGVTVEFDKNSRPIGLIIKNVSRLYNFKATTEERKENYAFSNIGSGQNVPSNYKATFLSS